MDRRRFALAALSAPTLLTGRNPQSCPARTVTPLDRPGIKEALKELEESIQGLEMRVGQIGKESRADATYYAKNATVGVRNGFEQLKRILSYPIAE